MYSNPIARGSLQEELGSRVLRSEHSGAEIRKWERDEFNKIISQR